MSSHHFVKEKQEPALYIHSEETLDADLLGQLLEWCPFVIVDEHALYVLNHEPIKIDLVIQRDLSDDEIQTWIANQSDTKILKLNSNDDKLISVLKYLTSENHSAISLIACTDEHFEKLMKLDFPLDIIQYRTAYKGFFIKDHFLKWKEKDSILEIESDEMETKNLIKQNNFYKVLEDGLVEIKVKSKTLIKEFTIGN
jgi:hypothetical protein